ncbi:MAG: nuclear transport factor 2 family protein, partial [Chitinophagaceae bacterium]|nr:nuclear transport factor 2 family protein [Chitinophagaceae bacterium]
MKQTIIFLSTILLSFKQFAKVDTSTELFKKLKSNDSLLFNVGFNTCNIGAFENLVSDNFEFYHDKGGISSSKSDFILSIKNNICSGTYKPQRKLIEGSLEVYPLEK